MSVNKVILVGRLTRDPESRSFPDGGSVCNITLATSESWKDKTTGERKEKSEFHRLVFRGKLAEIAQQYLHKGSQVYIEGRITTRKWQDQTGQDRYQTEIIVENMQMLGSKNDGQNSGQQTSQSQPQQSVYSGQNSGGELYDDQYIPF